jgi:hypothetical protein
MQAFKRFKLKTDASDLAAVSIFDNVNMPSGHAAGYSSMMDLNASISSFVTPQSRR